MVDDGIGLISRTRARGNVWHPWSPVRREGRMTAVRGEGARVRDGEGREYLDAVSAALNSSVGYGETELVEAAARQMRELHHYDLSECSHEPAERLAERLAGLLPGDLDRVLFVNSGSEAAEAAVRVALDHWRNAGSPRRQVVTFARGYHGTTALAQHLSGLAVTDTGFAPLFPVSRVDWPAGAPGAGDAEELLARFAAVVDESTAAVVVEPLINVGGGIMLPPGFLRGLRALCDRTGALLVLDEVFTGFGRTGRMFGFDHDGVVPDVVMLSKGISAGYAPLGAVAVRGWLHDSFAGDPFIGGLRYGHTTGGHAVACAVALRVLDLLADRDLVGNAARRGEQLLARMRPALGVPPVTDVRGLGLVVVVELPNADLARRVLLAAREEGLLLKCQQNAVMAVPPLNITEDEVEELATRWLRALHAVDRESQGDAG
ncbi:adenosylmethionine-8-amino-7-oxononanoate aminotransferase [Crossiella equi]|uniref:Adenosylmethionine-8-amino-7-oxononanoate aminotransferase n=1 Tax=Crossiella equi TaxID=130796 RepID=A0ABS5A4E6_9PSEU|nr:aminotransferase class III-fold pyridoxal phosphate-dependent enzyme [Crossiella equi]MBP2471450.1 adenosylmethionine-8-amino-7-oxononanoate aminotransferase [Crossiella equi]